MASEVEKLCASFPNLFSFLSLISFEMNDRLGGGGGGRGEEA